MINNTYVRLFVFVLLLLISIFTTGYSSESDITSNTIKKIFQKNLPEETIYTEVPRGLIISLDESILFKECETGIKKSALYILDNIAEALKGLPNYCVIENHIGTVCDETIANWELAMVRSANISEYFTKYNKIPHEQLFDIGYGEFMPIDETLNSKTKNLTNRIDFVIINYDTKR